MYFEAQIRHICKPIIDDIIVEYQILNTPPIQPVWYLFLIEDVLLTIQKMHKLNFIMKCFI